MSSTEEIKADQVSASTEEVTLSELLHEFARANYQRGRNIQAADERRKRGKQSPKDLKNAQDWGNQANILGNAILSLFEETQP